MTYRYYSDTAPPSTLLADIDNVDTSISLTIPVHGSFAGYPFTLRLEPNTGNEELVLVTAGANPYTVTRAYGSTTAKSHDANSIVRHGVGSLDLKDARDHEALVGPGVGSTGPHGLPWTAWTPSSVYNVQDYGAVGDGATNDTVAIQAAIDDMPATGGILVFPPTGSFYSINAGFTLTDKPYVTIDGLSGAEIRFADGTVDTLYNSWPNYAKDSVFRVIRCDYFRIRNIKLNGNIDNRTAYGPSESFNSLLNFAGCQYVWVHDCHLIEGMTDGIITMPDSLGELCTDVWIQNNYIDKNRRNNISCVGQHRIWIENNSIANAGSIDGINPMSNIDIEPDTGSSNSKDIVVAGNIMWGAKGTHAMSVGGDGSENVLISGNVIRDNDHNGLNLNTDTEAAQNTNVRVVDNVIRNCVNAGIRFTYKNVDLIADNIIEGCQYGVNGQLEASGVRIIGNTMRDNTHHGIVLVSFKRAHVTANLLENNTNAAGLVDGAGFSFNGSPFDSTALLTFNSNTILNRSGTVSLSKGPYVSAACVVSGDGNKGQNLNASPTGFLPEVSRTEWTSYTPALTGTGGWAIGNAVFDAAYMRIGKTVWFRIQVTWGGTTVFGTGYPRFSLPSTAKAVGFTWAGQGQAIGNDAGTNTYAWDVFFVSATTVAPWLRGANGAATGQPTGTAPFTWVSGDGLMLFGVYQEA